MQERPLTSRSRVCAANINVELLLRLNTARKQHVRPHHYVCAEMTCLVDLHKLQRPSHAHPGITSPMRRGNIELPDCPSFWFALDTTVLAPDVLCRLITCCACATEPCHRADA